MRATACILLLLALMMPMAPAGAETYAYQSDFSEDADGWVARSLGSASVSPENGGLAITGRTSDWHSPGREFPLVPGKVYEVSTMVFQDAGDSARMMISVAHTINGQESYENLAREDVPKGKWTALSSTYTAGQFDRFILYTETLGAPQIPFVIKDFTVREVIGSYSLDLPSLKDLYAEYFDFGCAVTGMEAINPRLMDFYASQFSIMTHANELKPDSVLDIAKSKELAREDQGAVAVRISAAKPLLDYAQQHGIKVHGHVLVWHSQTPEVFFREDYSPTGPFVSRDVMLSRLENYIRQVFELIQSQYPGLIVSWDVVNEAVDDATGRLRASNWTRVVGEDFVLQAFRFARKYAPEGVRLYYNDYSTPYEPKLTGILRLLAQLVQEGTIDGYGFQCHYQLNTSGLRQLQDAMDKVIVLGLTLRMSEMDILINRNDEENLRLQANRYGAILALFRAYSDRIEAVHTWGVTDNLSWKANQFPLLFDGRGKPKPAFYAVVDPLR